MPPSEMKRHIHTLDVIKVVLLLTGIGLSAAYVLLSFEASAVQARLKRQFEQDITHQQARAHFERERADRSPQLQTHAGGLAKLDIPKAGISAMVMEGTDDATLRVAVGHIQGTALPGQAGNVGLAGHRDSFFRGLRNIGVDDEITLTTREGVLHYTVESVRIAPPDDVSALRNTPYPALTLVTCYPFYYVGPAPRRWIVKARLMSLA